MKPRDVRRLEAYQKAVRVLARKLRDEFAFARQLQEQAQRHYDDFLSVGDQLLFQLFLNDWTKDELKRLGRDDPQIISTLREAERLWGQIANDTSDLKRLRAAVTWARRLTQPDPDTE